MKRECETVLVRIICSECNRTMARLVRMSDGTLDVEHVGIKSSRLTEPVEDAPPGAPVWYEITPPHPVILLDCPNPKCVRLRRGGTIDPGVVAAATRPGRRVGRVYV